jgi:nitroimidazol reductase NimA-like FMN-containing flavoprotein (pyridoxamine 5'-phosphate oxidase superfamily)
MPLTDLSHPDALDLLNHQPLAHLGYNGTDGFPRVIPIGFWWNGENIIVSTAPTSPKVAALTARRSR